MSLASRPILATAPLTANIVAATMDAAATLRGDRG